MARTGEGIARGKLEVFAGVLELVHVERAPVLRAVPLLHVDRPQSVLDAHVPEVPPQLESPVGVVVANVVVPFGEPVL